MNQEPPVLVLGAGINGAAIARELVLNNVPVCLVDISDLSRGATAASSRLIHGGLRYLEYGEFQLVRQSLEERERLLKLAPHLVEPLRLYIPVRRRTGGMLSAMRRFLNLPAPQAIQRGLWLVRVGLWLYDRYASSQLPRSTVHRAGKPGLAQVDPASYHWVCSYYDAQVAYPERLVIALLQDAQLIARERNVQLEVYPYHQAQLQQNVAQVLATDEAGQHRAAPRSFVVRAVVNATGAWIDHTLKRLKVSSQRLIGGTKGSHFVTFHRQLRALLQDGGVYMEAADGRPIFILPFHEATLVGTTDIPFEQRPDEAVATEGELEYLLEAVNGVFPQVHLHRDDVDLHTCGVRPLPYVGPEQKNPGAVTRRHQLVVHRDAPVPFLSVVGGKLTTCRLLAEEVTECLLHQLGKGVAKNTRERPLPGGDYCPAQEQSQRRLLAQGSQWNAAQVDAVWRLLGQQALAWVPEQAASPPQVAESLLDTNLPLTVVHRILEHEWVTRLDDLVERRLMLLYHQNLTARCLRQLAQLMVERGLIADDQMEAEVEHCRRRLLEQHGKTVAE